MTMIPLNASTGIPARYANRHGLVTGPTGTGKTVTLQTLIEGFSAAGVPVFASDVKGDLGALAHSCPHQFLDVYGQEGAPLRVPVWAFGADLLARALELTDAQAGCVEVGFAYADARGLPLDTLADLRALLAAMLGEREAISREIGLVGGASIGAVQRALLRLENQGAAHFFGVPGYDIADLMREPGRVSILSAEKLLHAPRLYSALMLWLLRELFQRLPEIGDMDRPRLVFVFDEAHTLFADCPAPLLRSIEQTARLIRSKGVGIYFASQAESDIPELIRAQLATRVEHARELGVGRARFTTLNASGQPTPPVVISPALPKCPLGAFEGPKGGKVASEAAPVPADAPNYELHARVFMAVLIAGTIGVIGGTIWLYQTGQLATVAVFILAALWALRKRLAES